jgi:fucose permease
MSASLHAAVVRPKWLTALSYGAMMSLAIGLNLLPVFLTTLSARFGGEAGLSNEQLGRLGASAFAGLVAGILITGPLADRWGAKLFAVGGNAVMAASLAGLAWCPTYGGMCALLFWLGLGAGVLDMVLSPVVAALNPGRRTQALNWLHSFYCVGAVVTIGLGTLVLAAAGMSGAGGGLGGDGGLGASGGPGGDGMFGGGGMFDGADGGMVAFVVVRLGPLTLELGPPGADGAWRAACLLLVALPAGLAAAMAAFKFPALSAAGKRTRMRALVREAWFVAAMAAIFLGGATEAGLAQWLPAYAERSLGYPVWMGGMALLVFSVAMALGRMAAGAAGGRWSPFAMMAWGCGATVALFVAGSFFPARAVALGACVLAGFTGSCLWPTLLAVTADRYPGGGASMFGALAALGNAGGIFMPWLVGWVADSLDLHWGLVVAAVAPAAMLPLVLGMRPGPGRGRDLETRN